MASQDIDFRYYKEYEKDKKDKIPQEGVIAPGQEQQDWKYYRNVPEHHKDMIEYLDSIPENTNKE